ncbi:hypothetical protein MASR1M12_07840 [Erysipelotrichia bacterium]
MTGKNLEPQVRDLDFHKGYEVAKNRHRPFPGQNISEPRVVIEPEIFKELLAHAGETVAVELCGVLVGQTFQDDAGPYLVISGSIRGKHARNEGAQVSFTHETWDYIHAEMEKCFRDKAIVGWYHTHPGFGIFLSDMDKFIQDYFFNQPFQVALVIDPVSNREGLFAWINGKTRALSRCWIGSEVHKLATGAVGSEEIRESGTQVPAAYQQQTDSVGRSEPSVAKENLSTGSHNPSIATLGLVFFAGFMLAMLFLRGTFFSAALTAARAETRELLGAWASDSSAAEEMKLLQSRVAALNSSDTTALAKEIGELQGFVAQIASASFQRRSRVQSAIQAVASQVVSGNEQSQVVLQKLREAMAESLLIQLMPYLQALSVSQPDSNRLRETRQLIEHIIGLDPRLGPGLKEKLPWLF